jgi:hypothetical protein
MQVFGEIAMVEFKRPPTIAYFSDYFAVNPDTLEDYGAFNITVINDLPLFIDPFLLFNSQREDYRKLHESIIEYLVFLRDKSIAGHLDDAGIRNWYTFKEVKQTWLGYSFEGNKGRGLGPKFARALYASLSKYFRDFGKETISHGSHLEKLCLFKENIGRDNISDFTTNLIKEHLLEYTQRFAKKHIHPSLLRDFSVPKVRFNYETETWEPATYRLPFLAEANDFVLLTPKDMLTKDETWISRTDLYDDFRNVAHSIPNDELRFQINNYFANVLPRKQGKTKKEKDPTTTEWNDAVAQTIAEFPEILDWYIRYKEEHGDLAADLSKEKVVFSLNLYFKKFSELINDLHSQTSFYEFLGNSYTEAFKRVTFLKQIIENQDGYRYLWNGDKPIASERDLQLLYKLTWYATEYSVDSEVNNGRGPVDFKISKGSKDSTLVEFKMAKNTKLKQNLEKQLEIYQKANSTESGIKVVFFFTEEEEARVKDILRELKMEDDKNIILIDARNDNKPSASVA